MWINLTFWKTEQPLWRHTCSRLFGYKWGVWTSLKGTIHRSPYVMVLCDDFYSYVVVLNWRLLLFIYFILICGRANWKLPHNSLLIIIINCSLNKWLKSRVWNFAHWHMRKVKLVLQFVNVVYDVDVMNMWYSEEKKDVLAMGSAGSELRSFGPSVQRTHCHIESPSKKEQVFVLNVCISVAPTRSVYISSMYRCTFC